MHSAESLALSRNTHSRWISHQGSDLNPALVASERSAFPLPPRDELEGPRRYFLPSRRHADDNGLSPAAVGALQSRPHHSDIPDALKLLTGVYCQHHECHSHHNTLSINNTAISHPGCVLTV